MKNCGTEQRSVIKLLLFSLLCASASCYSIDSDPMPQILILKNKGRLERLSWRPTGSSVTTVINQTYLASDVAYDWVNNKIYYNSLVWATLFRADLNGSHDMGEGLRATNPYYGDVTGLAWDWVTGNLYTVTDGGNVVVCRDSKTDSSISCKKIVNGEGRAPGFFMSAIALNPLQRAVYWTQLSELGISIWRAEMDGSNPKVILPPAPTKYYPRQIAIDSISSRLYWTESYLAQITSSDLEGGDVQTVVNQGPNMDQLVGIGLFGDRIYWGNLNTNVIYSSSKTGADISMVYISSSTEGVRDFNHNLVLLSPKGPDFENSTNRCKDVRDCLGICVSNRDSWRCLP